MGMGMGMVYTYQYPPKGVLKGVTYVHLRLDPFEHFYDGFCTVSEMS